MAQSQKRQDVQCPALALVEFDSIAAGIQTADVMVKKASLAQIIGGTIHPGKYLVMLAGDVGPVEESLAAGLALAAGNVVDHVFLPGVHPHVPESIAGTRRTMAVEALGIVETKSVAAAIQVADAGLKGARVTLLELRLADGLGGKGVVLFTGTVTDVEAGVEVGCQALGDGAHLLNALVIPQLHPEMEDNILDNTRFRGRSGSL
jgi:microcompartment protein CcmL/EutN